MQVGDIVRIKQWADMAAEFEVDDDGDIVYYDDELGATYFYHMYSGMCGKDVEVLHVDNTYKEVLVLMKANDGDEEEDWLDFAFIEECINTQTDVTEVTDVANDFLE